MRFTRGLWACTRSCSCCCVVLFYRRLSVVSLRRLSSADENAAALSRDRNHARPRRSVALALLMLFAFFDLVEEMKDLGRGNYRLQHIAAARAALGAGACLRGVPDRGADRHALRARSARGEHRVHRHAHFGRVAPAVHRRACSVSGSLFAIVTFAVRRVHRAAGRTVRAAAALAGDRRAWSPRSSARGCG